MEELNVVSELFDGAKITYLLIGIFSLFILGRIFTFILNRVAGYFPSKRFLVLQGSTLSNFILYLGGFITLFVMIIDPPKEVILAAAGSLAVAIGFALKDITSSILAGVVLLFDTPFKTGDRVTFDDQYGEIMTIGLRSVKLRTLNDDIVTIPNSRFISDVVSSSNYGALDMMVVTRFHIALDNDVERVKQLINEVIVTSRFYYLKKSVSFAIEEVFIHDKLALKIDSKAYVMDVRYEKLFQSDITTSVNALLLQHDVKRP